jgi:hypothetical protein
VVGNVKETIPLLRDLLALFDQIGKPAGLFSIDS